MTVCLACDRQLRPRRICGWASSSYGRAEIRHNRTGIVQDLIIRRTLHGTGVHPGRQSVVQHCWVGPIVNSGAGTVGVIGHDRSPFGAGRLFVPGTICIRAVRRVVVLGMICAHVVTHLMTEGVISRGTVLGYDTVAVYGKC